MRTRLAPTPSGALHVGNAYSFLFAWWTVRAQSGEVVLRIEDVDTSRSRREWVEGVFRDLEWLGLDWDLGPSGPSDVHSLFRQSSPARQARYAQVLAGWEREDLLYPCRCTRRNMSLSAPQADRVDQVGSGQVEYPGTCRNRLASDAGPTDAWRLRLPTLLAPAWDLLEAQVIDGTCPGGDPVLRRGDGCFAYHMAVCVDDADQGIDLVVRGSDLRMFSPLHSYLHGLLGQKAPLWLHHPLMAGPKGERLAKRIGSLALGNLRQEGWTGAQLVGLLAPLLHADLKSAPAMLPRDLLGLGPPRSPQMNPQLPHELSDESPQKVHT